MWKEIEGILNETVKDFPGIQLHCVYLCPKCLLKLSGRLECLPDQIAEDDFLADDKGDKMVYLCTSGHRWTSIVEIKEGYSSTITVIEEKKPKYSIQNCFFAINLDRNRRMLGYHRKL